MGEQGGTGVVPEDTLAFGTQTQRYIRVQRTRSKCRRCFTVLHHHASPSLLIFVLFFVK